jgi:hypothetical protein
VLIVRVLDGAHVLRDEAADAELARCGRRVLQQAFAERRIRPRSRDDASAVQRADVVPVGLDHDVDRLLREQALLDQQRFDGARAKGRVARFIVRVLVAHAASLSR